MCEVVVRGGGWGVGGGGRCVLTVLSFTHRGMREGERERERERERNDTIDVH